MTRVLTILAILISFVGLGNLLFLDYLFLNHKNDIAPLKEQVDDKKEEPKVCPQKCTDLITSATLSAKATPPAIIVPSPIVSPALPSTKAEYFIPLGSGSISSVNTWQTSNTAQATFDLASFTGAKTVYFETVMHIPNAQGEMRARLIDTSTPYIYAGQELRTVSGT